MSYAGAQKMSKPNPVVFLVDVDNTLLDNDRITADLMRHLEREVGHQSQERYWAIFEELRAELGYADYLGALQRYRVEHPRRAALPGEPLRVGGRQIAHPGGREANLEWPSDHGFPATGTLRA